MDCHFIACSERKSLEKDAELNGVLLILGYVVKRIWSSGNISI